MKILVVGDVHATTYWKKSFNKVDEYDHIVQLGDWFDSFYNNWDIVNQIDNFREAIEYKKKYPDKIHILLGNHDLNNYVMGEICSGHQTFHEVDIKEFLLNNMDYFDIGIEIDSYVFSHAGFSNVWMKHNGFKELKEVNESFHNKNYNPFRFNGTNLYGDDISQGPTWIRPTSLLYDQYFNKQVVGHTEISDCPVGYKSDRQELIVVDGRGHNIVYEIGSDYNKKFKYSLFRRGDNVKFKNVDEVIEGKIEIVDVGGAFELDETSYDILVGDVLYKHIPQSEVFV